LSQIVPTISVKSNHPSHQYLTH